MENLTLSALRHAESYLMGFEDVDNVEERETVADILAEVRAAIAANKKQQAEPNDHRERAEELKRHLLHSLLEIDKHWNELNPDTDLYNVEFPFDTDLHEVAAAVSIWVKTQQR